MKLVKEQELRVGRGSTWRIIKVRLEVEDSESAEIQSQGETEISEMIGKFNPVFTPEAGLAYHIGVVIGEGRGQHQLRLRCHPDAESIAPKRDLHRRVGDLLKPFF